MRIRSSVSVLALALALAAVAANAQQVAKPAADREIEKRVRSEIADRDIPGVKVSSTDGVVTLAGEVPSLSMKNEAAERARKVRGVKEVINNLSVAAGGSDQQVAQQVAERLIRYPQYTVFDNVDVHVKDGVVTLMGYVTMPFKSKEMAELAKKVNGVAEVHNKIEELPVSQVDDEIRYVLANRLYSDPMFSNYSMQANPPIHIVVKNGRVTLHGYVLSDVEKAKAGFIARGVFGVMDVDNRIQVERSR
ncbi:MAG: BON domain-containing protein [Vicinamibacterales bacterium]